MTDADTNEEQPVVLTYEEQLSRCNSIAKPMASKKVTKRVYKAIKGAKAKKNMLRRGIKEVTKALKKNEKGFVVFAGDVYPIDIYAHLMVFCEEKDIPYGFTPSKAMLGNVINAKRPACCVLVRKQKGDDTYEKALEGVNKLHKE